jgi:hypothetical protein
VIQSDLDEAAALLRQLIGVLGTKARTPTAVSAADMRQALGNLDANAETEIAELTFAASLVDCFRFTRESGATFDDFDYVRRVAITLDPLGTAATIVVEAVIHQTLVAMARIIADTNFRSRDEVERVRDRLSEAFDLAEDDAADEQDPQAYQTLVSLHAAAVRDLLARARPLPRMVTFSFPTRNTALWIANRLYGDGSRFAEIIAENRVVHPLFCPAQGRALSR